MSERTDRLAEFLLASRKLEHDLVEQDDVDTREEGIATWLETWQKFRHDILEED